MGIYFPIRPIVIPDWDELQGSCEPSLNCFEARKESNKLFESIYVLNDIFTGNAFYKWIIESKRHAELEDSSFESKSDVNDNANKHMVGIIRHLSQLVSIASDIFELLILNAKAFFQRTNDLRAKVQYCQDIVDNLDAKTVKVRK
ncbi:uncharacterized protein CEXT_617571 [Caerostris extrusa]|uniref:Uncharacterized protein n=1 Tax=Caerostris extrusa TaxID=172846 RepID=A0AAV4QDG1_CAEEX|nr:uncharacterized protein CEXT_617571 [Caerostris extrusa]